jgi:uncharacterized protein
MKVFFVPSMFAGASCDEGTKQMKCPKCEIIDLAMTDRSGVEIDYCTICRGVWLDRGELDKIIERSGVMTPVQERPVPQDRQAYQERPANYSSGYKKDRYDDDDEDDDRYKRRKKGFLGDLFDF